MKLRTSVIVAALLASGLLSSCSFGGGDETHVRTKTTTTGQELQDLKSAYDKGIISQREYEQQRERLLNER
jgi:hypothetical protein